LFHHWLFIGNVNLDSLVYLGNNCYFPEKLFFVRSITVIQLFYRSKCSFFFEYFKGKRANLTEIEQNELSNLPGGVEKRVNI